MLNFPVRQNQEQRLNKKAIESCDLLCQIKLFVVFNTKKFQQEYAFSIRNKGYNLNQKNSSSFDYSKNC